MKFRPGLFVPPSYQRERLREDRKSTWLELFYDLIFVVAIGQLATRLQVNDTFTGALHFVLLFTVVWWAWVGQTFYLARFDNDDTVHRIITGLAMFGVAAMAITIPVANGPRGVEFALSYAAVRSLLVFEYWRVGHYDRSTRPLAWRYALGFSLAMVVWLISAMLPSSVREYCWLLALIIDYGTPSVAGDANNRFPPHVAHLPERFGLFTIIVLGEMVVSIVVGVNPNRMDSTVLLNGFLAWIVAFCLWWGYFDGVRGAEERTLRTGAFRQWMYTHLPLTMAIVVLAVQLKHQIPRGLNAPMPTVEAALLGISLMIANGALNTIFLSGPTRHHPQVRRFLWPHWGLTASQLGIIPLSQWISGTGLLSFAVVLAIAQIVFAMREPPPGYEVDETDAPEPTAAGAAIE